MILVFSTCYNLISQFFDLDIENPLGRGTLARFEYSMYRDDLYLVLCLPRLTVLASIEADRPGAWFPGPLGPYPTWFPGIGLSRAFERVKVPGSPMKSPFCVGVF
jgi:hypothetical protein